MDEQQRAVVVRRRRSLAEAARLVAEFEESGLNQRQFCAGRGLCLSTFARYRQRLRAATGETGRADWVAVEVAQPDASGLAVVIGRGRKIEVGRGFDAPTLAALMNVLERC